MIEEPPEQLRPDVFAQDVDHSAGLQQDLRQRLVAHSLVGAVLAELVENQHLKLSLQRTTEQTYTRVKTGTKDTYTHTERERERWAEMAGLQQGTKCTKMQREQRSREGETRRDRLSAHSLRCWV